MRTSARVGGTVFAFVFRYVMLSVMYVLVICKETMQTEFKRLKKKDKGRVVEM